MAVLRHLSRSGLLLSLCVGLLSNLVGPDAHAQVARVFSADELRLLQNSAHSAGARAWLDDRQTRASVGEAAYRRFEGASNAEVMGALSNSDARIVFAAARVLAERGGLTAAEIATARAAVQRFGAVATTVGEKDVVRRATAAIGNASARPEGTGARFNGDFLVTEVTHHDGVRETFEYRGDEIVRVTITPPGASGKVFTLARPAPYPSPAANSPWSAPSPKKGPVSALWHVGTTGAEQAAGGTSAWFGHFDPNGADQAIPYGTLGRATTTETPREKRTVYDQGTAVVTDHLFDNVRGEDKNGRVVQVADDGGSLSFAYDANRALSTVTRNGVAIVERSDGHWKVGGRTFDGTVTVGKGALLVSRPGPNGTSFDSLKYDSADAWPARLATSGASSSGASFLRTPEQDAWLDGMRTRLANAGLLGPDAPREVVWEEVDAAARARVAALRPEIARRLLALGKASARPEWNPRLASAQGMLDTVSRSLAEQEAHIARGELQQAQAKSRADALALGEAMREFDAYRASGPAAQEVLVQMGVGGLDRAEELGAWSYDHPVYAAGAAIGLVALAFGPSEIALLVGTPMAALGGVDAASLGVDMRNGYRDADPARVLDAAHGMGQMTFDVAATTVAFTSLQTVRGVFLRSPAGAPAAAPKAEPTSARPAPCEGAKAPPEPQGPATAANTLVDVPVGAAPATTSTQRLLSFVERTTNEVGAQLAAGKESVEAMHTRAVEAQGKAELAASSAEKLGDPALVARANQALADANEAVVRTELAKGALENAALAERAATDIGRYSAPKAAADADQAVAALARAKDLASKSKSPAADASIAKAQAAFDRASGLADAYAKSAEEALARAKAVLDAGVDSQKQLSAVYRELNTAREHIASSNKPELLEKQIGLYKEYKVAETKVAAASLVRAEAGLERMRAALKAAQQRAQRGELAPKESAREKLRRDNPKDDLDAAVEAHRRLNTAESKALVEEATAIVEQMATLDTTARTRIATSARAQAQKAARSLREHMVERRYAEAVQSGNQVEDLALLAKQQADLVKTPAAKQAAAAAQGVVAANRAALHQAWREMARASIRELRGNAIRSERAASAERLSAMEAEQQAADSTMANLRDGYRRGHVERSALGESESIYASLKSQNYGARAKYWRGETHRSLTAMREAIVESQAEGTALDAEAFVARARANQRNLDAVTKTSEQLVGAEHAAARAEATQLKALTESTVKQGYARIEAAELRAARGNAVRAERLARAGDVDGVRRELADLNTHLSALEKVHHARANPADTRLDAILGATTPDSAAVTEARSLVKATQAHLPAARGEAVLADAARFDGLARDVHDFAAAKNAEAALAAYEELAAGANAVREHAMRGRATRSPEETARLDAAAARLEAEVELAKLDLELSGVLPMPARGGLFPKTPMPPGRRLLPPPSSN